MGARKVSLLLAVLAAGGVHASGGGSGPPGGPEPTAVGPPRLVGDFGPTGLSYHKFDAQVGGGRTTDRAFPNKRERASGFAGTPTRVKAKAPARAKDQLREIECVVPSNTDMAGALQGCMSEALK